MKTRKIITMGFMFSSLIVSAQNHAGKVIYKETIKMDFNFDTLGLDPQTAADLATLIPKDLGTQTVLYFNAEASLYQVDKNAIEDDALELNDQAGKIKMMLANQRDEKMFCDLKNQKCIEQTEFMTRKFLIEKEIGKQDWKLTGKQKMILNYPCQEAILQSNEGKVVAWFTPAIPVSTGPHGSGGLPGLILNLDMSQGKKNISLVAKEVDFKEPDKALIVAPKEGKKVTEKEYKAIVAEKIKEKVEQYGGNGNIIIQKQTR